MHQKRQSVTTKIPIHRKGTKYVVRASSHLRNSVPLVIAMRDMLKLAKNMKEVRKMIHEKKLKINGKFAKDIRESIRLFNILDAEKSYVLTLSKTHRFAFEEAKSKDRICKVIDKKLISGNKIQLNLHDGSNILSKDKINTGDSIYISPDKKITKHVVMEKGKNAFVMSGKYSGQKGKVNAIENRKVTLKLEDKEDPVTLRDKQVMVL